MACKTNIYVTVVMIIAAAFAVSGCFLFQRNEVEIPNYLKNEIPEPVAPDDGELAAATGELDKPFHELTDEELKLALGSQRWLVRANAAAEAGRRMSEAFYPELLALLDDSLDSVRSNARWSLWKLTGLPWNTCEPWCRRWVRHLKIEQKPENESFRLAGVPTLTVEQTSRYLRAEPLHDGGAVEIFGGEETVVFRVHNVFEKALELKLMTDERHRVGEYLADGGETVQREGEPAWALLALRESKAGWAERSGRVAVQAMTSNDTQFENVVLLEQDYWDLPFSVKKGAMQALKADEEAWLYCEQSLVLDVEGVLLLCGDDVLGYATFASAPLRRNFYLETIDAFELAKPEHQLAALRKSGIAWLHQAAVRLRGEPLKEFLGRCVSDLSGTSSGQWRDFIGSLLAMKIEGCELGPDATWQQWQEWWSSRVGQLTWDDDGGRFK